MRAGGCRGGLGIASAQRVHDPPVLPDDLFEAARPIVEGAAQRVDERGTHRHGFERDRVVGDAIDGAMELAVRGDDPRRDAWRYGVLIRGRGSGDGFDVRSARAPRGLSGEHPFDGAAQIVDVGDELGVGGADHRAAMHPQLDEPLALELGERLADRVGAYAIARRELAQSHVPAERPYAPGDVLAQLLVQAYVGGRVQWRRVHRHRVGTVTGFTFYTM